MGSFTLPVFSLGSPDPSGVDVTGRRDWGGGSCVRAGRGLKAEPAEANKSADGLKPEPLFVEARRLKKKKKKPKSEGGGGGGGGGWGQGVVGFIWARYLGEGLGHLFQYGVKGHGGS